MYLLDPTYIRDNVDYSFGDVSGSKLPCGYMRVANATNREFMAKYQKLLGNKPYMTLFIDNIRLYNRKGIKYTAGESTYTDWKLTKDRILTELAGQDLLKLCASLPGMDFIIFTGFEDTPVDDEIYSKIPDNVKAIYASNAISFGGKVHPMPYGLQRKLTPHDNRHDILAHMLKEEITPRNLLYLNHSTFTNPKRQSLNEHFSNKSWATVSQPQRDYRNYLTAIKLHKFMLCPEGNAIGCECHRDWEVLYMRRVPVIEYSPYKEQIFKGYPVLFVDSFNDVTESLLVKNDKLYQQALQFNRNHLDICIKYKKIIDATDLHYQSAAEKRPASEDIKAA